MTNSVDEHGQPTVLCCELLPTVRRGVHSASRPQGSWQDSETELERLSGGNSLFDDVLENHVHVVIKTSQSTHKFLVTSHHNPEP